MRNPIKVGLLAVLLTLSVAATAVAAPLDDATAAASSGDWATALRLLRPLADQGDPLAQIGLGLMYDRGDGVQQDYAEAVKWFRKAADQGDPDAQQHIGDMYQTGEGVPQDFAEAAKWLRKAADQGKATAQAELGIAYFKGQGVSQDDVQAYKWLNLAATRNIVAKNMRDLVATLMTQVQIAEAQKLAREWNPQSPSK